MPTDPKNSFVDRVEEKTIALKIFIQYKWTMSNFFIYKLWTWSMFKIGEDGDLNIIGIEKDDCY